MMPITDKDRVLIALTSWRENRSGGIPGMQSIQNVIRNRAVKFNVSWYTVCTMKWQFSSITTPGDSQLVLWPDESDSMFRIAESMAVADELEDLTKNATLYYNSKNIQTNAVFTLPDGVNIPFPAKWNKDKVTYTTFVEDHHFFIED